MSEKNHRPVDYSFMHLGGLYQAIVDTTLEACRRFGADKANSVICTGFYASENISAIALAIEIKEETGIEVSTDDLAFLGRLVHAKMLIDEAKKLLEVD